MHYCHQAWHAEEQARQEELSKAQPDSNLSDEDNEEVEATSEDDSNIENDVVTRVEQEATTTEQEITTLEQDATMIEVKYLYLVIFMSIMR